MSIELQAGQWYRKENGKLAYVIGRRLGGAEAPWVVQLSDQGNWNWFTNDGIGGGSNLVEHLPDCTGFDWQPSKSLGQRLKKIHGTTGLCAHMDEWWNKAAEAFLRDVLKPPAGKTLGGIFLTHYHGNANGDAAAVAFLQELTGLNFSAEVTP